MSLPKYSVLIDSGVGWLGQVPKHWRVKRLRFVTRLNPSKSELCLLGRETLVSFLPMPAIGDDGTLNLEQDRPLGSVEQGYTYFRDGDVTIAKITPCFENGKGAVMTGLTNGVGFGTTELIVARPSVGEVTSKYLHYLFVSAPFRRLGESSMYGAGGQKRVPDDFVRDFKTAFPPESEQRIITSFLDQETSKIDALISEQQRLIELLKEKRQAVISHAVTKGLNPEVRMKPSGIQWLGDVPAHWEVRRLRFVAQLNPSKSEQATLPKETLVSFLPMPAIGDDGKLNLEQQKPLGQVEHGYSYFREGDVTIAKITPCFENGKGAVMTNLTNGVGFGTTELIVVRPLGSRVVSCYLHYLFVSAQFRRLGESSMYGAGGQKRVPDDFVRNFGVAIPPKSEQEFIVASLKEKTSAIDGLVLEAKKGIFLLQERRSALISAAITGKIDVRNYAATQKDAA